MVHAFADDNDLSGPGSLIDAYDLVPDPKPSLSRIIELCKSGDIPAEYLNRQWRVVSILGTAEAIEEWMRLTSWTESIAWTPVPDGWAGIVHFLRDYCLRDAKDKGLLDGAKKPGLSARTKAEIDAGAIKSATLGDGGKLWIAPKGELIEWLRRRHGIVVKP